MSKKTIQQQIIAITGATATGKSDLALKLAQQLIKNNHAQNVFLLSVDSRQVYQGLEILTAADIPHGWQIIKEKPYRHFLHPQLAISLHGVSIIPIWQDWSPAHLQKLFQNIRKKMTNKDVLILVGGTGFYHRQINQPADTLTVKPIPALRQQLAKKSLGSLQEQLKQLDPEKLSNMNQSDINNPRRLIRAIEVARSPQINHDQQNTQNQKTEHIINLHLELNKQDQEEHIKRRVTERFKHAIHEVRACLDQFKLSPELPAASTIGFKELVAHLNHELSVKQALLAWQRAEIQYSRRQATWWKKVENLTVLEAKDPQLLTKALQLVL